MFRDEFRNHRAERPNLPIGARMKTETLDALGTTGVKVSVVGAVGSGWGALSVNEMAAIIGAIVAIAGLLITWYYKREASKIRRAEHAGRERERSLRMALMSKTGVAVPESVCDIDGGE